MIGLDEILSFALFSLIISFILAFPIIKLLYKFGIVRHLEVDFSVLVDARKSKYGIPIMGGLIVIIPILILNLFFSPVGFVKLSMLVFGISALLGALDDVLNIYGRERKIRKFYRTLKLIKVHKNYFYRIYLFIILPWIIFARIFYILGSNPGKGLFAHEKIVVQLLISLCVAFWLYTKVNAPSEVWIPFFDKIDIGQIFMILLIVIAVIGMTNAVNLADGMDGLSAGLLLPAFGALALISYSQELKILNKFLEINPSPVSYMQFFPMTLLCASVLGGLVAYLYFNIPPARFQMGDVGSLALGALLAVMAFMARVPLLLPIIGFPFVAEVSSSIIQSVGRRIFGKRIFKMAPLHHHFEMMGWNEEKVVMRFWLMGIVFAIIGLWIYFVAGFPF